MRYLSFVSLFVLMLTVSHGLCLSLALLRDGQPRMQLNSARSHLHPRVAPVRASLAAAPVRAHCGAAFLLNTVRPLVSVSLACHLRYADFCRMLRGSSPSLAMHRLLPNAARLLPLTCDASTFALPHLPGSSRAPSSPSLHALSSQARHWLEVRTIVFWTLTIASIST